MRRPEEHLFRLVGKWRGKDAVRGGMAIRKVTLSTFWKQSIKSDDLLVMLRVPTRPQEYAR